MDTLLRYRLKVDLFRQWLGEFKDIAHVLDTLNATVEGTEGLNAGTPVAMEFCTIDGLREQIRKMRKEASDHIATLEQESAANLQRALVAEKDADRLNFMLDEHCAIQEFSVYDMPAYNLNWYEIGEQQAEVYKSPREAIDAAIIANSVTQEVG